MQATVTNNPSYLHPEVNKILENFTKYVSKPLGLNKPMSEEKARHGNILWICSFDYNDFEERYLCLNRSGIRIEFSSTNFTVF